MKKFFELRVILQPKEGALLPLVSTETRSRHRSSSKSVRNCHR
jgi:hypothetical protein